MSFMFVTERPVRRTLNQALCYMLQMYKLLKNVDDWGLSVPSMLLASLPLAPSCIILYLRLEPFFWQESFILYILSHFFLTISSRVLCYILNGSVHVQSQITCCQYTFPNWGDHGLAFLQLRIIVLQGYSWN